MSNTALITGASGGIGAEFARYHAARRGDLIITARRADALNALKSELESAHGITVTVITCDLGAADGADTLYAALNGAHVDILINNAGSLVARRMLNEMEAEFWDFWSTSNGFDKGKWLETYISERAAKPLKPGKTRRNRISATRQRIEWIVTSAAPINCLETNIYSKATPTKQELSNHEMDSSVFEFLLKEIKPEILFSHGVDARKHIELLSNSQVEEDNIIEVTIFETKTKILSMPHLSRGWSKEKTRSIGEYLKTLCSN